MFSEIVGPQGPSPEAPYSVAVEHNFVRDENEIYKRRLCDQHTVEQIAMWTRETAGGLSVHHGDR
jgi:hypothetical protein